MAAVPSLRLEKHELHDCQVCILFVIDLKMLTSNSGNDQLDTQLLYFIICLLQSSTCFEQTRAHHQEVNCINPASGIVTVCKWPSGAPDGHLQTVTIPDVVLIKFDLLMMSTTLFETCRGL